MPEAAAILLVRLLSSDADYLIAYQIAFDILDNENQIFTQRVIDGLTTHGAGSDPRRINQLKTILLGQVKERLTL
jgi:hypothetical protein